jgi:hypothetical protein
VDAKHRFVYFYELKISTVTRVKNINNIDQTTIQEFLNEISKTKPINRHYSYQKDTLHFYIADWQFDEDKLQYHILINKSDRNTSNPIFSDPLTIDDQSKKIHRRKILKENGEGEEKSSHIVIQLSHDDPYKAQLLLERYALAGAYHLEIILKRLISDCRTPNPEFFKQNHPSGAIIKGKPDTIAIDFVVHVDGLLSLDFESDLSQGTFREIVLISDEPKVSSVDNNYFIAEKTETIKLTKDTKVSLTSISKILKANSKNYSKARVRFKHENGTDRDVEVATANLQSQNYVRRARIDSPSTFESAYDELNKSTVVLMSELF